MKAYKVELLIIDFDEIGEDGIMSALEHTHYANHCISPDVMNIVEKDVGEWDDEHPLNDLTKRDAEYKKLFG